MCCMSVTAEVSQDPIGWLNFSASENMYCMSVTAEVFQDPMGSLKGVSANSRDILVTIPTSQWAMSPYLEIRPGLSSAWDVRRPQD